MKLMRRISLRRKTMRHMAVVMDNHRHELKAVAYTLWANVAHNLDIAVSQVL
jgi:hypothetical protein